MSNDTEIDTGAKKDEGVKVTLSLNNEMLAKSFTDEEVKEFRDGIVKVLRDDYHDTVTEALANCFMRKLADFDFTDSVKSIIYRTLDERNNR